MEQLLKDHGFKKSSMYGYYSKGYKNHFLKNCMITIDHIDGKYFIMIWCDQHEESGAGGVCIYKVQFTISELNKIENFLNTPLP